MAEIVYLNGNFVLKNEAFVSPEDRGFNFADGIYEVIKYYGGKPFRYADHMDRCGEVWVKSVLILKIWLSSKSYFNRFWNKTDWLIRKLVFTCKLHAEVIPEFTNFLKHKTHSLCHRFSLFFKVGSTQERSEGYHYRRYSLAALRH